MEPRRLCLQQKEPAVEAAYEMATGESTSTPTSSFPIDGLSLDRLSVGYGTGKTLGLAVNELTLLVPGGRSLCLVGSSGAGKSSVLSAILGLLPASAQSTGHIHLPYGPVHQGRDSTELLKYRRRSVGTVFQDAVGSLTPGVSVLHQVATAYRIRHGLSKADSEVSAKDALSRVGLPQVISLYESIPAELSGGMCQRVSIALALSAPKLHLILADEPTSSLDSVMAAQILDLLFTVQSQHRATLVFITHDIRLHRRFDEVGVMSEGKLVEISSSAEFGQKASSKEGHGLLDASRCLG